jgi:hypothetical protein
LPRRGWPITRATGSHYWADVDHWQRSRAGDARPTAASSTSAQLTGLSFDTGEVPGGQYFDGYERLRRRGARSHRGGKALALRGVDARLDTLATLIRDGVLDLELTPRRAEHRHRDVGPSGQV